MSAKNWSQCPRCVAVASKRADLAKKKARAAYGRATADEHEALRKKAAELELMANRETARGDSLREDWSIGVNTAGVFEVSYTAQCQCGYEFAFSRTQQTDLGSS